MLCKIKATLDEKPSETGMEKLSFEIEHLNLPNQTGEWFLIIFFEIEPAPA